MSRQRNIEDMTLEELEEKYRDLKGRIPAHSVNPAMIMELEELEEEILKRKEKLAEKGG